MAKIQRTKLSKERIRSAWIFLTPMFICLAVVAIYPLITTINYSFTDARLGDLYNYNYVGWFLPYISEIARILKPTGSFILNINDKSMDGFRHPFIFELIYAIHNIEDYCDIKNTEALDMHGLRLFERLFWNKGKYLAHPSRFGDKVEYLFWFSKTKDRKFNSDPMRLEYDTKSVKRMQRPLLKRFVREGGEEITEYNAKVQIQYSYNYPTTNKGDC
mgnify:CR=1 FL=1